VKKEGPGFPAILAFIKISLLFFFLAHQKIFMKQTIYRIDALKHQKDEK
jgi:hypothetical protein